MPTLKELQERGDVEVQTLMGVEEKEALAEAGTPFIIRSVQVGEGKDFGGYWEVTIELNGRERVFNLGVNDNRDSLMETLASVSAVEPISNCRLVIKSRRGGNAFLMIEPADTETEPNGGKQSAKR
jgi:hypothetical protein